MRGAEGTHAKDKVYCNSKWQGNTRNVGIMQEYKNTERITEIPEEHWHVYTLIIGH